MKAHVGVDSEYKLIHSVVATAANGADSQVLPDLLHGRRYRHNGVVDEVQKAKNRTKSRVRAKVEHPIGVIKRIFGFVKVRYRGLEKNANRLFAVCALTNLYLVREHLLRVHGA
jgi:IS5 family transposase